MEAAGHFRAFSSFATLAETLANDFSVYRYDRRGRGTSTDTAPYAIQREVEDLAGPDQRGWRVCVRVRLLQRRPPDLASSGPRPRHSATRRSGTPDRRRRVLSGSRCLHRHTAQLVAADRRSDAVERFHAGIGLPAEVIADMRGTEPWSAMESVAPTLVYDAIISACTTSDTLAAVTAPTLVLDSTSSSEDLTGWAATVAEGLPDATHGEACRASSMAYLLRSSRLCFRDFFATPT